MEVRWCYRDLAAVTQVHVTTERTWELPIPLLLSSPQLEMTSQKVPGFVPIDQSKQFLCYQIMIQFQQVYVL